MISINRQLQTIFALLPIVFVYLQPPAFATAPVRTPVCSPASIGASYRAEPALNKALSRQGVHLGDPIFIRIFKLENQLEMWIKNGLNYTLLKTYTICDYSGDLGPKLREGDKQSPEGFYHVMPEAMHPWSKYHLAFNLGFPNRFDLAHKRTGSNIMIHGRCSSRGCFAMADFRMDEIYTLADAAIRSGQDGFDVHIFPFRLTKANLEKYNENKWYPFWRNLKEGYDLFEENKIPPVVGVLEGRYIFSR